MYICTMSHATCYPPSVSDPGLDSEFGFQMTRIFMNGSLVAGSFLFINPGSVLENGMKRKGGCVTCVSSSSYLGCDSGVCFCERENVVLGSYEKTVLSVTSEGKQLFHRDSIPFLNSTQSKGNKVNAF